jgi:hypothetical protein
MRSLFGLLSAAAIFVSLAIGAPAAVAGPSTSAAKPKLKVKVLTTDQSSVVAGKFKVRVSGKRGSRVRLTFKATTFDEGSRTLAKPKSLPLGRSARTLTVAVTPAARKAAEACGARTLTATAKGAGKSSSSREMKRDSADCKLRRIDPVRAASCEFIAMPDNGLCMLPFPSDFYTRNDRNSPTGKRINFPVQAMPQNRSDKPIDPSKYLASDGFSQGQGIVLKVPGIDTAADVAANDFVGLDELSRYTEPDQRAVVIEVKTGKRWPIWVEIDSNSPDPERAALQISPATNFNAKGRYIVALRNLEDAEGNQLEAPDGFRYYRDSLPSGTGIINQRRQHFEGIFKTLRKAKIKRSELYLAWDFTVASNQNNYRRALSMRDRAFAELGDTTMADRLIQGDAPAFTVTSQPTNNLGPKVARQITGTFTVPCFLTKGCAATGEMTLGDDGLPTRQGNYQANFQCIIPPVGLQGPTPPKLRPFIYGHGLLGDAIEVVLSPVSQSLAQDHQSIACATNEIGMDISDRILVVPPALQDMSKFNQLADRLQQGLLNELFLARLMYHPDGLGTHPAFQDGDGTSPGESVIDTDDVYYVGASQGGIMGGPLTALSPDFVQSALVVGAMNYSTLLVRSSNWETFSVLFNPSYPDPLSRPLVMNLVQMLWDRGEPNGYAHVTTDNPPPNTPEHRVTLHVALGDHQVSNFASDVMARSIGMKTPAGGIDDRRWPNYEDLWNIPRIGADEYPYRGSNIVYWDGGPYRLNPDNLNQDIGTGVPPYANVAPDGDWEDPHSAPRGAEGPIAMMDTFLQPNGYIEDICNGLPCTGGGWDGDFDSVIPVP